MTDPLLPPSLLPRLERLSIASKRRVRGTTQGKRRSGRLGASLEFADYREYAPGDDIRRFDWGVYARTGRPFVRQYWDEQELHVNLYLDVSASMDFGGNRSIGAEGTGAPHAENKLHYAKSLAAAVGYMALAGYDRVQTTLFASEVEGKLPPIRGKASAAKLFTFLQDAKVGGVGDLATALRRPQSMPRQAGMTWIFSDFWLEGGIDSLGETLSWLLAAGQEIVLVQVLSPEEILPKLSGDLRLLDSELGTGKEIALTGKVLERYGNALEQYRAEIARFCSERGIRYVQATTDLPLEKGIFETLRGAGVVGS
ncbi:uncharacterized protein (DUF58 family) [Paenibacillus anaericanus]|uniref:DUF58 domain-containing protein n=1 Tax=Paenibacillus anaericanus TaxID=170367 RepID=UPI002786D039|nr:DUF58 domain-containing protein [Paenibacillus anaericanus]MDQ0087279.1 uncharacterized protein (DUF58 family) [Paenibacillus anaericanus]